MPNNLMNDHFWLHATDVMANANEVHPLNVPGIWNASGTWIRATTACARESLPC